MRGAVQSAPAAAMRPAGLPPSGAAPQQSAAAGAVAQRRPEEAGGGAGQGSDGAEDGTAGAEAEGDAALQSVSSEGGGALPEPLEPDEELHISAADLALMEDMDISIGAPLRVPPGQCVAK